MPKNPHAQALARLSNAARTPERKSEIGRKAGLASAKALTKAQRIARARKAGEAKGKKKKEG